MRVLSGFLQPASVFVWLCMLSALFSNLVKTLFDPSDYRARDEFSSAYILYSLFSGCMEQADLPPNNPSI